MIKWNGKTVLATEPDLTIESDTSSRGWGASCQGTSTGGPWSPLEKKWHINCIELLAATLALKTFVKNTKGLSVLLKIDNTTAVAYINNQGGTISKDLIVLTRDLSREEHSHPSTIPTWSNEPGGRHGIEIHEGSIRLETGSFRFSENQQEVWFSGSGPVCNQINQPVPSLLQLVARSICRSNRRLSPGLDNSERFCQPTLEPSTESASKNTESRGISNSGNPSMETSAMVSPPTVITSRLATPATQAGHGNRVSPNNAPTSRLEHLRERLDEQGLSSQATDLILNSWRTKTNKSYDSLFGRWNHRCTEQGSNPFSGPVSEVANFLATLYQEGYQYNSVNAYRSAISSVHEKVDGVPVGQHPIITRLVKGVFNVRPPIPRYSSTWDVQKVLKYLDSQGKQTPISLKALTLKTAFLLAITRPSRSADLSQLNITRIRRGTNGISFLPSALAKQSRQGKPIESFYFPAFLANTTLCPVRTLDKILGQN